MAAPRMPTVPLFASDGVPNVEWLKFFALLYAASGAGVALPEVTYAALPGSPAIGDIYNVSDSNTATWGATMAGSGGNHVAGRWNGSNWTVIGK